MAGGKKREGQHGFVLGRDPIHFARVTAPGLEETATPKDCFVAVFDVLGFCALRAALGGTAGLYQLFVRSILPGVLHSAAGQSRTVRVGADLLSIPDTTRPLVDHRIFSDTVVFFSPGNTAEDFFRVLIASLSLLRRGFSGLKAPFRGAIGHGDLIVGHAGVLVGSAIEDAYKAESSQVWAGCRLTPACTTRVKAFLPEVPTPETAPSAARNIAPPVLEYHVPLCRRGPTGYEYVTEEALVLDWTTGMYEGAAAASFNKPTDDHQRRIVENTIGFETWARSLKMAEAQADGQKSGI